jgi:hypothetical protein
MSSDRMKGERGGSMGDAERVTRKFCIGWNVGLGR